MLKSTVRIFMYVSNLILYCMYVCVNMYEHAYSNAQIQPDSQYRAG